MRIKPAATVTETVKVSAPITCVTGLGLVEFAFTGTDASTTCSQLYYRLIRTFQKGSPSLEAGAVTNENQFATNRHGDTVSVLETGSDDAEVNELAAGYLASVGYHVHFGRWTSFKVP